MEKSYKIYEIDKMVATEIELECLIVSIVDGLFQLHVDTRH